MQKGGYVYIMCSMNNTTLYTGVTSTLGARVTQHKENFSYLSGLLGTKIFAFGVQ